MGALLSRFRWKRSPSTGVEATGEPKEDSINGNKHEIPFSASYQGTTDTDFSRETREIHSQFAAPLAQEEECIFQGKDAAPEAKNVNSEEVEEKENVTKPQDPEVRELQRIHESKLEKEKTVDNSGCTTEKTVYSQFTESTKIQESKGPAVDPFANSPQTIFPPFRKSWHEDNLQFSESQKPTYIHSVSVTVEDNQNVFPKSTSDDLLASVLNDNEKSNEITESVQETYTEIEPVKHLVTEKLNELTDTPVKEIVCNSEEVTEPGRQSEQFQDEEHDYQREDVADAVVKIQAGVRGYLTRKALKEKKDYNSGDLAPQNDVSNNLLLSDDVRLVQNIPESLNKNSEEMDQSSSEKVGENDAAVRIQAMYRGYRTRKELDDIRSVSPNPELQSSDAMSETKTTASSESDKGSPRTPVTVTESFVPILSQKIVITPPSSPTNEIRKDIFFIKDDINEGTKELTESSSTLEPTGDYMEIDTVKSDEIDPESEDENQAATKIQAAFRGYKVRKDKKFDTEISEEIPVCSESNFFLADSSKPCLQGSDAMGISTDMLSDSDAIDVKFGHSYEKQENAPKSAQLYIGVGYSSTSPEIDDEGISEDIHGENAEETLDEPETDDIQWQSSDIYINSGSLPSSQTGADREVNRVEQKSDLGSSDKSDIDQSQKSQ